ncbi:acyl-CoA thioester hydrolase/BAAT C-terminal domain-containing protein [Arthrobacter sp. RCC_34]|uniref:acyl-CoA thioester hydrolase/BAAT C-terminal domain-containing protein n=1 Tax=Arthrobacter sp. RCC_34 TaxID=3239230 RepID=UPI0035245EFC
MSFEREDLHWARPVVGGPTGVLVLAGSSGRIDAGRADVLAASGATALAIRWFGGTHQPAAPREIRLETFVEALDLLAKECDQVAILGLSYGAEAALLTATRDSRVTAVIAVSPTDVVWEGARSSAVDSSTSKWTWRDEPVPFVPFDRTWSALEDPPAFAPYYRQSRQIASARIVESARIPVERFTGDLVLIAGGDDQVWPSLEYARNMADVRSHHGLKTALISDETAGHQVVFPGELATHSARPYRIGGSPLAAERLGASAWPTIQTALGLGKD